MTRASLNNDSKMKFLLRHFFAALLPLVLWTTQAAGANLLSNPGFELDAAPGGTTHLLGWSTYGPNAYGVTSAALAHAGSNYFKVYQESNGAVNYTGVYQDYN